MRHACARPKLIVFLLSLSAAAVLPGCTQSSPEVLCVMRNPQTGQTVRMYKEIPFKVPADYDEQKHIAHWRAAQIGQGFTEEVRVSH